MPQLMPVPVTETPELFRHTDQDFWDSIEFFVTEARGNPSVLEWEDSRCVLCNDIFPTPPLDTCIDHLTVGACICTECLRIPG